MSAEENRAAARRLLGTWRLVSIHSRTVDGQISYPFGRKVVGYYFFAENGYLSVSLMRADRPRFTSEDLLGGSTEEKVAATEGYISYVGKYEVHGDKLIIHPEVSFFPNWVGADLVRIIELTGNRLTLSTRPTLLQGVQQTAHMVWERV